MASNKIQEIKYRSNQRLDVVCQPSECGFYYNSPPVMTIKKEDLKLLPLIPIFFFSGLLLIFRAFKNHGGFNYENKT